MLLGRKNALLKNFRNAAEIDIPCTFYSTNCSPFIIRVRRNQWAACYQSEPPCYTNAAAIIIEDQDYACKDIEENTKEKIATVNCFRPSYSLRDIT